MPNPSACTLQAATPLVCTLQAALAELRSRCHVATSCIKEVGARPRWKHSISLPISSPTPRTSLSQAALEWPSPSPPAWLRPSQVQATVELPFPPLACVAVVFSGPSDAPVATLTPCLLGCCLLRSKQRWSECARARTLCPAPSLTACSQASWGRTGKTSWRSLIGSPWQLPASGRCVSCRPTDGWVVAVKVNGSVDGLRGERERWRMEWKGSRGALKYEAERATGERSSMERKERRGSAQVWSGKSSGERSSMERKERRGSAQVWSGKSSGDGQV
eukprot:345656-Chlamydomonas_euryale.AAC.2